MYKQVLLNISYINSFNYTKTNTAETTRNVKHISPRFWQKLNGKKNTKTLKDTGRLRPKTCIITNTLCKAVTPPIKV